MADGSGNVTVTIYGQEYTFVSDKPAERIIRIANYVDEVISGLADRGGGASVASLAMLASINIAEELISERDEATGGVKERAQLEKDIAHFQQLWEDAKRSHLQYKEDMKLLQGQKDALQEELNQISVDAGTAVNNAEAQKETISKLEGELRTALGKLERIENRRENNSETLKELQDKLKEVEGNYFELQMENIRIKGELEKFKKG
ncbi:MAG: cell division protein ZapA [Clostridiales Family XIII bacterium]|jgi:cell division protein ZapA (FtsZ GTPase activity inhibitor)|nr:cell division protein ZapA [Clostridiales Family XIII bacterium]